MNQSIYTALDVGAKLHLWKSLISIDKSGGVMKFMVVFNDELLDRTFETEDNYTKRYDEDSQSKIVLLYLQCGRE